MPDEKTHIEEIDRTNLIAREPSKLQKLKRLKT